MFTGWHGIRSTNGNVGWKRMCHKVAVWALPPQFLKGPRTSIKEQPTINCHRDSIDGLIQCAVQDLVDGYGLPTLVGPVSKFR